MQIIFISGPYRASSEHGLLENIRRAENVAVRVWQMGFACICPHKNTAFLGGIVEDQVFLDGDLEIIRRCDAVVCVSGWETSTGATGEVSFAEKHQIPVFKSLGEFEEWAESRLPQTR